MDHRASARRMATPRVFEADTRSDFDLDPAIDHANRERAYWIDDGRRLGLSRGNLYQPLVQRAFDARAIYIAIGKATGPVRAEVVQSVEVTVDLE